MTTQHPPTPTTVEPGQVWRDNDPRSRGTGEFTVIEVEPGAAVVYRHDTGRRSTIRVDRLIRHTNRRTGYTYLGRAR